MTVLDYNQKKLNSSEWKMQQATLKSVGEILKEMGYLHDLKYLCYLYQLWQFRFIFSSLRSQVICLGGVFLSCYLIFKVKKSICIFFLSLASRYPPRGLYNFIFNRREICPILFILAYFISFSSSQVSHFNRFFFIFILCVPFLKLLSLIFKSALLYSISLRC